MRKPACIVLLSLLLVPACTGQAGRTNTTNSTAASIAATTTIAPSGCTISPDGGVAGSRVTLSCSGFAPGERVAITFRDEVLTTTKATTDGVVVTRFPVPTGFAGAHHPGRRDTFQAKGRQSGKVASLTFMVTG